MTTKAQHTPGPWELEEVQTTDPLGNDMAYYIQEAAHGDDYEVVAVVPNDNVSGDPLANARLIAAAPEMLAFLGALVNSFSGPMSDATASRRALKACVEARALLARIDGDPDAPETTP